MMRTLGRWLWRFSAVQWAVFFFWMVPIMVVGVAIGTWRRLQRERAEARR